MKFTSTALIFSLFFFSCQQEIPSDDSVEISDPPVVVEQPVESNPDNPSSPEEDIPESEDDVVITEPEQEFLRIGVLGDLNGSLGDPSYASSVTTGMKHILSNQFDIIIGTGDFTSGEDYNFKFPASRFKEMWASFDQKILTPITNSGVPFAPSAGNHDASIERERGYYQEFWKNRMPAVTMVSTEMWPFYYSFSYKGVFFISLDDVLTYKLRDRSLNGITQREWLINQLASPEARSAKARIVFGHVPIYPVLSKSKHSSGGSGKYYEILSQEQQGKQTDALESILKNGEVSLAVFGHSHAYFPGFVHQKSEAIEQGLRVLSMPCLGYGNRYLDQRTSSRSTRGFGNIVVSLKDGSIDYDAIDYNGATIPKSSLPSKISPYSHVDIHRYDLIKDRL